MIYLTSDELPSRMVAGKHGWAVLCLETSFWLSSMGVLPMVLRSTPMFGEFLEPSFFANSSIPFSISISV